MHFLHFIAGLVALGTSASGPAALPSDQTARAVVVVESSQGSEGGFASQLAAQVERAGYSTRYLDLASLCHSNELTQVDLLVIPNAQRLPLAATGPLEAYFKAGGKLLALGLPAWGTALRWLNDRWMRREEYDRVIATQKPAQVLEDFEPDALPAETAIPRFETLCPAYQFYEVNGPVQLSAPAEAVWPWPRGTERMSWTQSPSGAKSDWNLQALQPRPRGVGFAQGRPWRWQPLLEARASNGEYRGAIGTLLVHDRSRYRAGVWVAFTPAKPEFYLQSAVMDLLGAVCKRLRAGVFLLEGGSEFFTVFEDQSCHLGARVANWDKNRPQELMVRLSVMEPQEKKTAFSRQWPLALDPGQERSVETTWKPAFWPPGGYTVTVELLEGGSVVDRLAHELNVWRSKPNPSFIEARDGGFWLAGKPWKAHGVNYMPSSGIGVTGEYFEYWLGRGAYDPEIIQRDLERIKSMNLNAVSVFIYYRSLGAQHLLDFLRRCERLGLRVNQSLRPGTPLDFRWSEMKALIEYCRLAQNDTVFAYDLAWEPSHYNHEHQRGYAPAWTTWVLQHYGSLAAAERAWGAAAVYETNAQFRAANSTLPTVAVPASSQLTHDGPWRKLVVDYRAFLDSRLREKYAEARRLVRSVDPHHPVSFRMQLAGDPTFNSESLLPYDFYGLADAVDIWEPEAYGRIGEWEQVKPGRFTAAYARLCHPSQPVLWAEMGYNVWDPNRGRPDPDKLAFAARYYGNFYRMMTESGADGVFFWWYPGGFRVNENSDFGIINCDGSDRSITEVIRREGPRFLAAPKPAPPNAWIEVDRDRDARGLYGIYEAAKDDYWRAVEEGKRPALRWAREPTTR